MAEGRELPVEHRDHLRGLLGKDHIVHAQVAVHQSCEVVVCRECLGQPLNQPLHGGDRVGLGGAVLLGPHVGLARDVPALLAEAPQPRALVVDRVNGRACLDEGPVKGRSLLRRGGGLHARALEEAAGDVVAHKEWRAHHIRILREEQHLWHRHIRAGKRGHARKLTVDGMGAAEQFSRRLLAQHERTLVPKV